MPTPRDSTDDLSLPTEPSAHTSCPPETVGRPSQWSQQVSGDVQQAIVNADPQSGSSQRIQNSSASFTSPGPIANACDRVGAGRETIEDMTGYVESTPPRLPGSPRSMHEDEKDREPLCAAESVSSATDLTYSVTYGIPSCRVFDHPCIPNTEC